MTSASGDFCSWGVLWVLFAPGAARFALAAQGLHPLAFSEADRVWGNAHDGYWHQNAYMHVSKLASECIHACINISTKLKSKPKPNLQHPGAARAHLSRR